MFNVLTDFLKNAAFAFRRFPFVLLCAFLGSLSMSMMIGDDVPDTQEVRLALISQVFSLAIPLFFATALFSESLSNKWHKTGVYLFAAGILLVIYFHLKHAAIFGFNQGELSIAYLGYFLALHLLVSFIPIVRNFSSTLFWHFNKTLFLRAAITALYVGVLFGGLAGAFAALDQLLGFNIKPIYYGRLWFFMAGLGSVWIFTAQIPRDLTETIESGYPRGLQVFAQFVLMPLVLLYLVILYIYGIQIVIKGTLPIGWVSNLIMAFAVIGMLALLLLHPLSEQKDNKWVNHFTRGFYIALLPLLVLLFVATFTRIHAYGFTELRYALLALAIWLSVITIFMIVTRNRNIWAIPVSLFIAVLVVFFLPYFNIYSISKKSQTNRLHDLLNKHEMWSNSKGLQLPNQALPDSIAGELYDITKYLATQHGVTGLEPSLKIPAEFFQFGSRKYEMVEWLDASLAPYGIEYKYLGSTDFAEAVADTTVVTTQPLIEYPDLSIRFKGEIPKMVPLPKGTWSHVLDLNFGTFKYIGNADYDFVQLSRDITEKNLRISTKQFTEVFDLDALMKQHVHLYKFPKKSAQLNPPSYFFPNQKEVTTLYGNNSALQVFEISYVWDKAKENYQIEQLKGKLWIR